MLNDKPISTPEEDRLDRAALVERMVPALVRGEGDQRKATDAVIGLTGPWGSGKSSVLDLLREHLGSLDNIFVVPFNPWLIGGRDDLLLALLDQMQVSLGKHDQAAMRPVVEALSRYRKAIAPLAGLVPGVGATLRDVIGRLLEREPRSPLDARKDVEKALREATGAIVVLIDEFDRLEPGERKAMGQALKAALDLPNISWVIALDSEKVTSPLAADDRDWALGFLAKVLTVNIPLRPLMDEDKTRLLETLLKEAGADEHVLASDLYPELRDRLVRVLTTPRDIRRTAATFGAMHAMVGREVNPADLLAWAALGARRPDLQRQIADNIDWFLWDPADPDREQPEDVEAALGLDRADPLAGLVCFLFPRMGSRVGDRDRFGRVQWRANAWSLLWLGVPPFNASREDVQAFWNTPSADFLDALPEAKRQDLIQRTFSLLAELPEEGDERSWRFLLERETEESRGLRDSFLRAAVRSDKMKRRMRAVFEALRNEGDFRLVPSIIRSQAARDGIGPHSRPDELDFLTEAEVRRILPEEVAKWSKRITSGQWLQPPYLQSPLWGLLQLGEDEAAIRAEIERQLEHEGAILAFAHLLVPPGTIVDRNGLEQLANPEKVIERAEEALRSATGADRERLEDILAVAKGKDLWVFRDERAARRAKAGNGSVGSA